MAISLYDATVAGFLQTLGAVSHFLEKSRKHLADQGKDANAVLDARLAPDMWPLRAQVLSLAKHSHGAIEACRSGSFSPPELIDIGYAGLQAHVESARSALQALTREEVEALQGREVIFTLGPNKLPFVAEDFLFSFSMPNFHFHSTTAYDILRAQGVPLGKRDYMGALRMKR